MDQFVFADRLIVEGQLLIILPYQRRYPYLNIAKYYF